jgi:hypothetical protein
MNVNEDVGEELYFYLADGRVIKNIPELISALREMEDWVFEHHVNSEKNDFVEWLSTICKNG